MVPSRGQLQVTNVSQPAKGKNFSYTLPAGFVYQLVSVRYNLTAGASIPLRIGRITITYGGLQLAQYAMDSGGGSTNSRIDTFYAGTKSTRTALSGISLEMGISTRLFLPSGTVIASSVTNLAGTDQFDGIVIYVIVYPET